jgi:hypothetical protein
MEFPFQLKKFDIQSLQLGQEYYPSNGGEFKDQEGNLCLLTHAQRITLTILKDLPSPKEQFEFFCFAYLRQLTDMANLYAEYPKAWEQYKAWKDKFGLPWNGNVKYTLPPVEVMIDWNVINKDGANLELLKEKFNEYASHQYILYP